MVRHCNGNGIHFSIERVYGIHFSIERVYGVTIFMQSTELSGTVTSHQSGGTCGRWFPVCASLTCNPSCFLPFLHLLMAKVLGYSARPLEAMIEGGHPSIMAPSILTLSIMAPSTMTLSMMAPSIWKPQHSTFASPCPSPRYTATQWTPPSTQWRVGSATMPDSREQSSSLTTPSTPTHSTQSSS